MDDRHLTVIVVPHGDLETRSFVITYRKLKVIVLASFALMVLFGLVVAFLFPVFTQATRATSLERQLVELEAERAKVAELARTLAEVEEQYEKVRQLLGADSPADGGTPLLPALRGEETGDSVQDVSALIDLWPLTEAGWVTRALSGGASSHTGLDIAAPQNSYIRAAGPGTVRVAGSDDVYGQYIILTHARGIESVYGHASRLLVTAGDEVRRGQVIGMTGSTGRSTAPHLHFEVRVNGEPVDPLRYVRRP